MGKKKKAKKRNSVDVEIAVENDQLGENPAQGRMIKAQEKKKK